MKYDVLKRSHLKKNIVIGLIAVLILSAVILTFTKAKYRVTESIPLVSGTINFSPYDFNLIAMYLNQGGALLEGKTKTVPKFGYTLNENQSTCIVDDANDERITMNYVTQTSEEEAYITFDKMSQSGTKCSIYFDLIPDNENPTVSISTFTTDTSIMVTANANDNMGIYYYYFKLDNEEEVRLEENSYTFEGLQKDDVHTVSVRVEDAAGNEAISSKEVTVGFRAEDAILASANAPTETTVDWTGKTTYYYTENPNNWVQFAGFWWRIIRINGDGTIRMIYQGTSANTTGSGTQIGTSQFNSSYEDSVYVGYMYTSGKLQGHDNPSTIKGVLDQWYQNNLADDAEYIDGNAGFCGDRRVSSETGSTKYFQTSTRMNNSNPSLRCQKADIYTTDEFEHGNGALEYPIGLISTDEAMFAGMPVHSTNPGNYLYTAQSYWTMSPYYFNYSNNGAVMYIVYSSYISAGPVKSTTGVRPVINLRADIPLVGSGTTSDPFKVVGAS